MRQFKSLFAFCSPILLSVCLSAQSTPHSRLLIPQESIPNLGRLKIRLIAYHSCSNNSGCYASDLNRQSDLAIAYLTRRVAKAKQGERLALVLDVDETALSNWDEERQDDFGYIAKDWNEWVDKKQATAIEGTLRLYNDAVKHGVSVFFITGRSQAQEEATADNLKAVGYRNWVHLAARGPHPRGQTVVQFKSEERKKIVDEGYRIILNVGDQMSDLNGSPQAEVSVKLPNPFYYIP
ncbi:MAG: HAD family acid phosphatase [Acidobacteriaceae bacterium]